MKLSEYTQGIVAKHDDWRQLQVNGLVLRVETILADHPAFHNRVRPSSNTDRCGLPQIMIDYTTDPRDTAHLAYMVQRSTDWLKAAGATDIQHDWSLKRPRPKQAPPAPQPAFR